MSDWYSRAREADGRTDDEIMSEIHLRADAARSGATPPPDGLLPSEEAIESMRLHLERLVHSVACDGRKHRSDTNRVCRMPAAQAAATLHAAARSGATPPRFQGLDARGRLREIVAHLDALRSDGPFIDGLTAEGPWWTPPDGILVRLYEAIIAASDTLDLAVARLTISTAPEQSDVTCELCGHTVHAGPCSYDGLIPCGCFTALETGETLPHAALAAATPPAAPEPKPVSPDRLVAIVTERYADLLKAAGWTPAAPDGLPTVEALARALHELRPVGGWHIGAGTSDDMAAAILAALRGGHS